MSGLLAAEALKLRATRAFWVLVGVSVLPAIVIPIIALAVSGADAVDDADDLLFLLEAAHLGGLIAIVIGIIASAGEHRRGTASRTFMATPRRWRVVAAKGVVCAVVAAMAALVSVGIALAITLGWATSFEGVDVPDGGALTQLVLGGGAYWVALALIGVGLGAVLQNQVLAIVGAFVLLFVIEPTVFALAEEQGAYFPGTAAAAMYSDSFDGDLTLWPAVAVSVVYCLVLVLAGALVTERRDVT